MVFNTCTCLVVKDRVCFQVQSKLIHQCRCPKGYHYVRAYHSYQCQLVFGATCILYSARTRTTGQRSVNDVNELYVFFCTQA